jgi:type IV pilus assembly protein PilM
MEVPEAKKTKMVSMQRYGINISVCGSPTILRYISFPKMNAEQFKQAIKFEAEKHIPFRISEVNLGGCILRNDLADNKMWVLLAAAKKDFINQHLKVFIDLGISVNKVDIDAVALINAFNFNYLQEKNQKATTTTCLLDIGASISSLNILDGDLPRLSRDIHIGGISFSQKIADIFSVDLKSAEAMKIKPPDGQTDKLILAAEPLISNLAREVRASFDYYESQGFASVSKIFLSGGGSLFVGLKDMLANILGIEVEYWDPLRKIQISGDMKVEEIRPLSSRFAVTIGLALCP